MKKKNQKGFTLIELIVVIAILAILALIAIPRFAGFTDKAKLSADNQYAALVANTVNILMVEGTITTGGVLAIANDGAVSATSGLTLKTATPALVFNTEIEKLVAKKKLQTPSMTYSITIASDGSYTLP